MDDYTPMNPELVRERVHKIRESIGDPETAHGMEDDLFRDIVKAISKGICVSPKKCATEALWSLDLDFPRWCA